MHLPSSSRTSLTAHVSRIVVGSLVAACGGPAIASHPDAPDAGPGSAYDGIVLATVMQQPSGNRYFLFADFVSRSDYGSSGAGAAASGPCGCVTGFGTPYPRRPPSAGVVTVSTPASTTLASLSPTAPVTTGSETSSSYFGTGVLGATSTWSDFPGSYASVMNASWGAGDSLLASAAGGDVHAFSGTLHTAPLLAGIAPAFASGGFVVDRAHDLDVSWTPDGVADDGVLLMVDQTSSNGAIRCTCAVADSAGTVTLGAALLAPFATTQLSGTVALGRTTVSTATSDNATIQLVGEALVSGDVTFR